MTEERWAKVRTLLEQALERPSEERSGFLLTAEQDPEIVAEAERLLGFDDQSTSVFGMDSWLPSIDNFPGEMVPGAMVGRYRLMEEIGRGGMGAVYRAERADGAYRQQVALKLIQDQLNHESIGRRFEAERQILAGLVHPGIARLLDGGVTDAGRPYLVLEFVEGAPIDVYCATAGLDLEARLRLFLKVADSVQFAHQQLVLHLDLKPANILITQQGEPRLLDFGIARILEESEGEWRALATLQMMTPRYASPEQLRGGKLGVASDVFSLGTLLYRLLTGGLPYAIEKVPPMEAARMVCDEPPKPPSDAAPEPMRAALCGDLDAILLRALRKEPEHRYPTVAALTDDIERYLQKLPVQARTSTFRYVAGRFVRRHRTAMLTASAMALVVLGSGVAVVRSAVIARQQRAESERQRAKAVQRFADLRSLAHSYVFDLDAMLQPIPGTLKVRTAVMANALRYLDAMSKESDADDDLLREVGQGYSQISFVQADETMASMNDRAGGLDSARKALAIQHRLFDRNPTMVERAQLMRVMWVMAHQLDSSGDPVGSERVLQEAWKVAQAMVASGPATPRFMYAPMIAVDLGVVRVGNGDAWNLGDPAEGETWLKLGNDLTEKCFAVHPELASTPTFSAFFTNVKTFLALALEKRGQLVEAENLLHEAKTALERGPDVALRGEAEENLAQILAANLLMRGKDREASAVLAASPPMKQERGADRVANALDASRGALEAMIALRGGRLAEGRRLVQHSLAQLQSLYEGDPEEPGASSIYAAAVLRLAEESSLSSEERQTLYRQAEAVAERYAKSHPGVLSAVILLGQCELGLAVVARKGGLAEEAHLHAVAAEDRFRSVLAIHPVQPEASALLQKSLCIAGDAPCRGTQP